MIEAKNSQGLFKGRFKVAEESVNLKTGQWKLSSMRNRKKKNRRKLQGLWEL
jgi:hypothetical protein